MKLWWEKIKPGHSTDDLDIIKLSYIECLKRGILFINDRIYEDTYEKYIVPLMFMNKKNKNIKIFLNTYGGEIEPCFALIHCIENISAKTKLIISGNAFSSGFYIAMAGHNNPNVETYCTPYARAMFHNTYIECDDDEDNETRTSITEFQKKYDREVIYNYVTTHSNITLNMIESWEGSEKYFTAKELENFEIARII